jgi:CheY-like chemotaxis protein
VDEATNGREALARLQKGKPDVILLDLMMPEMDGFQVVAALQKEAGWRDIPVIVITSLDLDEHIQNFTTMLLQLRVLLYILVYRFACNIEHASIARCDQHPRS